MSHSNDALKAALMQRLLGSHGALPTSALGRLGRTAGAALRSGRLLLGGGRRTAEEETPLELEALAKIVGSLGELKGIAMKAGQLMSYIDVALPEELRAALSVLQTHAQPMPFEQVRGILRAELGERAEELLASMEETPLAAASIGQVHRARLADGTRVAVKVQYPEIDRAIEADFGPAAAGSRIALLLYPGAKGVDAVLREARERFLEECDYLHEARCQRRFAETFAGHPVLRVPEVHEAFCSRRVLTTRFMEGEGLEAFLAREPSPELRDRLGQALFEFYVGALFQHRLYNCDPHPGNYLFQSEGAVVMLDYGCTRLFEPEFVCKLARLTRAVHRDTRDALHASFVELGMVREGQRYDFETARGLVRAFYGPMLRDETRTLELGEARSLRQLADSKRQLMKLHLPGEFLFLFRIRFGLMSVLARLGARANWYRLEEEYVAPLAGP
jgi:predicted unusual protein kinase regulating ubiquinone biosynthesis (AarF/ABC1/UbiB family)